MIIFAPPEAKRAFQYDKLSMYMYVCQVHDGF